MHYRVIPYQPTHKSAFYALNAEWIEHFFGPLEAEDERSLHNPEGIFLQQGGAIFMAVDSQNTPIAAAALKKTGEKEYELCKTAVSPSVRGQGVGRLLLNHVLEYADNQGIERVFLLSNRRLAPALTLYQSCGFAEMPLPDPLPYERVDIAMQRLHGARSR